MRVYRRQVFLMRAPLWLSQCGEKGVVRKGCLKKVVSSYSEFKQKVQGLLRDLVEECLAVV
jgi:hypothetical protein